MHVRQLLLAACCLLPLGRASAGDWPQYMGRADHTGDGVAEELKLPLGLAAQIKLDDAVLTAPAVVGGRVYVVDQMGTAYALEGGRVLWKSAPDGAAALGGNTSSPCVTGGRVYYGTTAGAFHILDAQSGAVIRTVTSGSAVISAPTFANGSIYFQAMDAVLRCLDLDGKERWRWDHYHRYVEPKELTKALEPERGHPGSYDRPHHGGGDVAVHGKNVVTSFGWDVACIEDAGTEAKLVWCNRAPTGRDGIAPMSASIAGDWVYVAGMGADGHRNVIRLALKDGARDKAQSNRRDAYAWNVPAVRGSLVAHASAPNGKSGIAFHDFGGKTTVPGWFDDQHTHPFASAHVLTRNHLVATSLRGEAIILDLTAKSNAKPFRFQTPNGKGIGSTPAVSDGRVYFGCDDGYFYVLAPDGDVKPVADEKLAIHEPRGTLQSATGKTYDWPSTYGNAANTSFADDAGLKPPLRLRWAVRGFGHFLTPCLASGKDVITVSLLGLVTCHEQATGRMRWRTQMPGPEWATSSGMLADGGRLYLPRPTFGRSAGTFHCLDLATGKQLWSADIGGRYIWERAAPVAAQGVVAFGSSSKGQPDGTLIQAWDAATGQPAWKVELNVAGNRSGSIGGCTDGKVMYYTAGAGAWQFKQEGDKLRGELVAIDAKTGKVLRRHDDLFSTTYPVLAGEKLLLNEDGLRCVTAAEGELVWKRPGGYFTRFSVGDDFLVMRGYGGHGAKVRLDDGKDYPNCKELGGETHACSSVALTPGYAFAGTVGGLNVRDVKTGELLWRSPGFAPRGCVNPALANGRVFWPSAASGVIYCWEPVDR